MATIVNNGQTITITDGSRVVTYNKNEISVITSQGVLNLVTNTYDSYLKVNNDLYLYSNISSPVTVDVNALVTTLESWLCDTCELLTNIQQEASYINSELDSQSTTLSSISSTLSSVATEATLSSIDSSLSSIDTNISNINNSNNTDLTAIWLGESTYTRNIYHIERIGLTPSVTTIGTCDEFTSSVTLPSSAATLSVSSSNANDTSAGTGLRTFQLYGLDGSDSPVNEIITLNGTTAVTTTNSYKRITKTVALTTGSLYSNVGNIYIGDGTVTAGVNNNSFCIIKANTLTPYFSYFVYVGSSYASICELSLNVSSTISNYTSVKVEIFAINNSNSLKRRVYSNIISVNTSSNSFNIFTEDLGDHIFYMNFTNLNATDPSTTVTGYLSIINQL